MASNAGGNGTLLVGSTGVYRILVWDPHRGVNVSLVSQSPLPAAYARLIGRREGEGGPVNLLSPYFFPTLYLHFPSVSRGFFCTAEATISIKSVACFQDQIQRPINPKRGTWGWGGGFLNTHEPFQSLRSHPPKILLPRSKLRAIPTKGHTKGVPETVALKSVQPPKIGYFLEASQQSSLAGSKSAYTPQVRSYNPNDRTDARS